jgi:DEAD/DEAH box helicase domain-containing protein
MTKLKTLLGKHAELQEKIRPGVIDGDTPYAERDNVAKNCNIIMTNPDTLHAAILPGWKANYKSLLGRIKYVVIDEAHMYEGVFGAHVAMVLSRFIRLAAVCSHKLCGNVKMPIFLACSATMFHPEHHFRLLCPIPKDAKVTILAPEDDGSPRAAKHFFVWNPPIMDINGFSTGRVTVPKRKMPNDKGTQQKPPPSSTTQSMRMEKLFRESDDVQLADCAATDSETSSRPSFPDRMEVYRRHAADETALLVARAVSQGVRCIAFCRTRCLVEWVYERAISALKSNPSTKHLAAKVESYRGGYTMEVRRSIEHRLFNNDLLAVIGTNALELGVDVGGIDLTLHCGYPSSYASLLQQAGRAGRGATRLNVHSIAVMVCFNSPAEQQIWRRPRTLLSRGKTALVSMQLNVGLVQGHLLCAGEEYPLMTRGAITTLFLNETAGCALAPVLSESDLFGSRDIYDASIEGLLATGMLKEKSVPVAGSKTGIVVFKTHPVSLIGLNGDNHPPC